MGSLNIFKAYTKLIESECYLSEKELSLKKEIEVAIHKFFELYDEFRKKQEKTRIEPIRSFSSDSFSNIRL